MVLQTAIWIHNNSSSINNNNIDYGKHHSVVLTTVINSGRTMSEVLSKRREFITNVMRDLELEEYIDKSPEML